MGASGAGPTARTGSIRAKGGLIPLVFAPRVERRPAGAVTVFRTAGVGRPVTPIAAGARSLSAGASAKAELVDDAVTVALRSVDGLARRARDVADAFRRAELDEAQRGLSDLVERTQMLLRVAATTAQATGTRLEVICRREGLGVGDDTRSVVAQLVERQFSGDWPALAVTLRVDFTSMLAKWRRVFEALGQPPDDDPRDFAA